MSNKIADAFREGYKKGWDKCREEVCRQYNLDEKEVFAWECSDKDLNYDNHEKKVLGFGNNTNPWEEKKK